MFNECSRQEKIDNFTGAQFFSKNWIVDYKRRLGYRFSLTPTLKPSRSCPTLKKKEPEIIENLFDKFEQRKSNVEHTSVFRYVQSKKEHKKVISYDDNHKKDRWEIPTENELPIKIIKRKRWKKNKQFTESDLKKTHTVISSFGIPSLSGSQTHFTIKQRGILQ